MVRTCRFLRRLGVGATVAATFVLASASASAQRPEAKFEWQKHEAVVSYGVPRVGKHTLDELQVGSTWRMGAFAVSTLTTQAPLIAGDSVVAPGAYRVNVARPAKEKFELTIEGAGSAVDSGNADVLAPATLAQAKTPNEKLEIALAPAPAPAPAPAKDQTDAELRALNLSVQYGAPLLTVPLTIVGTQPMKVKGFAALDVFKLPEPWLSKRLKDKKHSPVATLVRSGKVGSGESDRLNLMLAEDGVVLLPAMLAPTENNGFGAIPKPDGLWTFQGTVKWGEAAKPSPCFHVETAEIEKDGTLHVAATLGARSAEIRVASAPVKK
jgi:hypothetical protein